MEQRKFVACSGCFVDEGLRIMADNLGKKNAEVCLRCNKSTGKKLTEGNIGDLTFEYFYYGATFKTAYGGANAIQFNEYHYGDDDIDVPLWLKDDMKLLADILKVGFFHYGPRLWRLGHIGPLEKLQKKRTRPKVINRILTTYPSVMLKEGQEFYRLRKNPQHPVNASEYDSPPERFCGKGRLDTVDLPVLYGSTEIDTCIHECRVTLEDDLYIAKLKCSTGLRMLDLTAEIVEDRNEFESLALAVDFLFGAASHAYKIIREIARFANAAGFDGILYNSYYRSIHAEDKKAVNIALFGRPVSDNKIILHCVNRLVLKKVEYQYSFGPGDF